MKGVTKAEFVIKSVRLLNQDLTGGALLGQIETTWEEMKIVAFLWEAVANKAKTDAKSKEVTIAAGAESDLLLLIVPGMDVLILLMDRERRKNVSSSEWKATANTAKKKTVSDTKTILWIRE
jgi:hypothetical protein